MTNFEKWKQELTRDDVAEIITNFRNIDNSNDCTCHCPLFGMGDIGSWGGEPKCSKLRSCNDNIIKFFKGAAEDTLEKWKSQLSLDVAVHLLGLVANKATLMGGCMPNCPAMQENKSCVAKIVVNSCDRSICKFFEQEAE